MCASSGSCISSAILASGTSYHKLLAEKKTVQDVRQHLGQGLWSEDYKPARPIATTAAYQSYKRSHEGRIAVWDGDDASAENRKAALVEVYNLRGPYYRGSSHPVSAGMALQTMGVSEVIAIPSAIHERGNMKKQSNPLTIWYDANGHFVGYLDGDVRKGK